MKTIRLGFVILLIAGMAQAAEIFEIISYFPDKGTVRINQGAGQTNRPFSSFNVAEQQKINRWLAAKTFDDDSALLVDIRQEKRSEVVDKHDSGDSRMDGKKKTTKQFHRTGTQDVIAYAITLKNQSKIVLSNLTVEYQLFYETDDGGDKEKKRKCNRGPISELRSECTQTNRTTDIVLRDEKVETYENSFVGGDKGSKEVNEFRHIYNKDQLKGLYVCVSMLDENGDVIKREYKIGRVPEEEEWDHYKVSNQGPATSAVNDPARKPTSGSSIAPKKPAGEWSEEEIEKRTKTAERNCIGAVLLGEYYSRQGDEKKAKKWAKQARDLLGKLPPAQREATAKRIAALDRLAEKTPQE